MFKNINSIKEHQNLPFAFWKFPPRPRSTGEGCPSQCCWRFPRCTLQEGRHKQQPEEAGDPKKPFKLKLILTPCGVAAWGKSPRSRSRSWSCWGCRPACSWSGSQRTSRTLRSWSPPWPPAQQRLASKSDNMDLMPWTHPETNEGKVGSVAVWAPFCSEGLAARRLWNCHCSVAERLNISLVPVQLILMKSTAT